MAAIIPRATNDVTVQTLYREGRPLPGKKLGLISAKSREVGNFNYGSVG